MKTTTKNAYRRTAIRVSQRRPRTTTLRKLSSGNARPPRLYSVGF